MKSLLDAVGKLQELKPYLNKEYKDAVESLEEIAENLYIDEYERGTGYVQMTLCDSKVYVELGDTKDQKTIVTYVEVDGEMWEAQNDR